MVTLEARIQALEALADFLSHEDATLDSVVQEAGMRNPWFTPHQCYRALRAIRDHLLHGPALRDWAAQYAIQDQPLRVYQVGLVLAGNIPAVGFHDWLCVFMSGHRAVLRFSDKDNVLLPRLLHWLVSVYPELSTHWKVVDQLRGFDAVIATGSDNSARYFRAYFSKYPHIIRSNRNGVAVLFGEETREELDALADDIFAYYGLGCRNVSHLFVPQGYDFRPLLEVLDQRGAIMESHRYANNYDYQHALLLLNKATFHQTASLLLRQEDSFISPVATLHYSLYRDEADLHQRLERQAQAIQCVVSARRLEGRDVLLPGTTQSPGLDDYADGVDTMTFLTQLPA